MKKKYQFSKARKRMGWLCFLMDILIILISFGFINYASLPSALATALGGEVELLGHSSGGVLALECLPAEPGLYRAAVVSRRRSTTLRPPGATHWCGRGAN